MRGAAMQNLLFSLNATMPVFFVMVVGGICWGRLAFCRLHSARQRISFLL